jgi:(1->4)-alpha-D-glucan 1-alpha-D-glucosylmutase
LTELLELSRLPKARSELAVELVEAMADGRIKLYVTALSLRCRRAHPGLFSVGSYSAVDPVGATAEHIFSFVRRHLDRAALVAAPRLPAKLMSDSAASPHGAKIWGDTMLLLPEELGDRVWHSLFTGETLTAVAYQDRPALRASQVFARFPVALLLDHEEQPDEEN